MGMLYFIAVIDIANTENDDGDDDHHIKISTMVMRTAVMKVTATVRNDNGEDYLRFFTPV